MTNDEVPILQMRGIVKEFPGARALDGVDLTIRAGEVHCLLGQNGAGKSTLIKVLAGVHQITEGEILLDGAQISFSDPQAALSAGIATIHQELDLVDGLTIAENIFLGHEISRGGFLDQRRANRLTTALLQRLGHGDFRPTTEVGSLSSAGKQIVSMARALSHDARVLVMDEPSAVLASDEVDGLFRIIEELRGQGVAIIYISHRLEEIRRIGDRITVLKDGRSVGDDLDAADVPTDKLIRLMTGRSIEYVFPPRAAVDRSGTPLLEVTDLSRRGEFDTLDFTVHPGEVVGIAGLVGSGRSEILETIYGARRATTGTVRVEGRTLSNGSPAAAVRAGVGLCPEERKYQALILDDPAYRNITLPTFSRFARGPLLDEAGERRAATEVATTMDVRPLAPARAARAFSGGNQQKIVLARWLLAECRVLLLDEPTRGVDVGARAEIYALIRDLAAKGLAVVVVSSELEEVIGLSDRVLTLAEGRVVDSSEAVEIDEHRILDLIMEGTAL